MFNYFIRIGGWNDGRPKHKTRILNHEKEFSQEEFNKMCNEINSKNVNEIARHLICTYGFKTLSYAARWDEEE
ncbi:hypothetical protein UT300012_32950 [Paraclostridium bifermentans]